MCPFVTVLVPDDEQISYNPLCTNKTLESLLSELGRNEMRKKCRPMLKSLTYVRGQAFQHRGVRIIADYEEVSTWRKTDKKTPAVMPQGCLPILN